MSDIRIYNLKNKETLSKTNFANNEVQNIIESISLKALGIEIIKSNYHLQEGTNDIIESLGIDENYNLVIIEYRFGKFGQVINKGLMYIDFIKEHVSHFKILVNEIKGNEIAKLVTYNPRLVVIGDDFNKFDDYAIKQMPFPIELIKFEIYEKNYIVLEKVYQSRNINHQSLTYQMNEDEKKIYRAFSEFVLSLGDEVIETGIGNFISYRKIKNFIYLTFNEGISCNILINNKYKVYKLNKAIDVEKIEAVIENSYDQN